MSDTCDLLVTEEEEVTNKRAVIQRVRGSLAEGFIRAKAGLTKRNIVILYCSWICFALAVNGFLFALRAR